MPRTPDDESTIRKALEEEMMRKIDAVTDYYLGLMLPIIARSLPPQEIHQSLQRAREKAEIQKPLVDILSTVFQKPDDCEIYQNAVVGVTSVGPGLGFGVDDLEDSLYVLRMIHSPECKDPSRHEI